MSGETEKNPAGVYDADNCKVCGTCLSRCNYLRYGESRAKEEIRRLRAGLPSPVLTRCAGCWSCDLYCPNGCRPYSLIRSRWNERYNESGLPERARYLMPHEFPNFRSIIKYPADELAFVESLKTLPGGDTALYTGCNTLVIARALQSRIFDGLPMFGSLDYCCGEMYYRMGAFDAARQSALKLKRIFAELEPKKIVFTCAACMNMITNIYPKEFGIDFGVEGRFVTDWLEERIDSGKIEIKNPLKKKAAVQDSCHSKMMGREMHDSPRRLLAKLGAEIVEMKNTKDESNCCGIASGCAKYSIVDMTMTGMKRLADAGRTGADMTAAYCHGCLLSLGIMRQFEFWAPPLYPLIQLVQLAAGEEPPLELTSSRARQALIGILLHAGPKLASRKRFRLEIGE
jgi:Fe-S oxidoreductase